MDGFVHTRFVVLGLPGGVGLCEYVQHLSAIDYIAISGDVKGRAVEFVGVFIRKMLALFENKAVVVLGC